MSNRPRAAHSANFKLHAWLLSELHSTQSFYHYLTVINQRKERYTSFVTDYSFWNSLQCRRFLRARECFCSRKRHVETLEERRTWGESKGEGRGLLFRPRTYPKGYYFYSPQSSSVIKSKMAATTIRTWTSFRQPKIRLHCRLLLKRTPPTSHSKHNRRRYSLKVQSNKLDSRVKKCWALNEGCPRLKVAKKGFSSWFLVLKLHCLRSH